MNKVKTIFCIMPEDNSLAFLDPVFDHLKIHFPTRKILPTKESHAQTINEIQELPAGSNIFFFGHGASHCLYGACDELFERIPFINKTNIDVLTGKSVFALSCRSSEFLYNNKSKLNSFIGFGNLPTDWDDVFAERDFGDTNYLKDIDEETINYFRDSLAQIILASLKLDFGKLSNFRPWYLYLRLLINKEIANLLLKRNIPNYRALSNLWFETKHEILIY